MPLMSHPSLGAGLVGLALAVPVLMGCSVKVGHYVDAKSAAHQISNTLSTTLTIPPPSVRCPSGIKAVTGRTFDCATVVEGQGLTIHATLDDNNGRFTPKMASAVVVVDRVVAAIKDNFEKQNNNVAADVDCGSRKLLILSPGDVFSCKVTEGSQERTVQVTVQDLDGNVHYQQIGSTSTSTSSSTTTSTTSA